MKVPEKQKKQRLDVLLVTKGLAHSRETAKSYIMSGNVYVDSVMCDKPGSAFSCDSEIIVKAKKNKYVSRGGMKLEKALENFNIDLNGKVCIDIGASTGGFTDCMLKNGAIKVFSVDVGYGQLDWNLRIDERVVVLEKTNARYLQFENIGEFAHFISVDVSFISLQKILPPLCNILQGNGIVVLLIKPQFEAGRNQVGKKGVVKDKNVHKEVITNVINYAKENNLIVKGLDYSPIKGPNGNIEYLICLSNSLDIKDDLCLDVEVMINECVDKSHSELDDIILI